MLTLPIAECLCGTPGFPCSVARDITVPLSFAIVPEAIMSVSWLPRCIGSLALDLIIGSCQCYLWCYDPVPAQLPALTWTKCGELHKHHQPLPWLREAAKSVESPRYLPEEINGILDRVLAIQRALSDELDQSTLPREILQPHRDFIATWSFSMQDFLDSALHWYYVVFQYHAAASHDTADDSPA